MLPVGSSHLLRDLSHLPLGSIILAVVCIDVDVASCDIGCCKIVNNLLVIGCESHFGFLLNAGSKI